MSSSKVSFATSHTLACDVIVDDVATVSVEFMRVFDDAVLLVEVIVLVVVEEVVRRKNRQHERSQKPENSVHTLAKMTAEHCEDVPMSTRFVHGAVLVDVEVDVVVVLVLDVVDVLVVVHLKHVRAQLFPII